MTPSEQHDHEELERRLRDAFAAKALGISDADLDHDREDDVAAALARQAKTHPATRWFAGIGSAAAAAAIIAIAFVGLHDNGQRQVVDGLPPAVTSSASATASDSHSSAVTSQSPTSSGPQPTSGARQPARPGNASSTSPSSGTTPTSGGSPTVSGSTASSDQRRTALSGGSAGSPLRTSEPTTPPATASASASAAQQPPAMPGSLPQSRPLTDQEYAGAVPLDDPSGGPKRELSMPSDTKWQRTASDSNSLTVRITYLSTDIEAYWRQTLPGQGWVQSGGGWSFPGTGYTVSAISDKGSFTVTW